MKKLNIKIAGWCSSGCNGCMWLRTIKYPVCIIPQKTPCPQFVVDKIAILKKKGGA